MFEMDSYLGVEVLWYSTPQLFTDPFTLRCFIQMFIQMVIQMSYDSFYDHTDVRDGLLRGRGRAGSHLHEGRQGK